MGLCPSCLFRHIPGICILGAVTHGTALPQGPTDTGILQCCGGGGKGHEARSAVPHPPHPRPSCLQCLFSDPLAHRSHFPQIPHYEPGRRSPFLQLPPSCLFIIKKKNMHIHKPDLPLPPFLYSQQLAPKCKNIPCPAWGLNSHLPPEKQRIRSMQEPYSLNFTQYPQRKKRGLGVQRNERGLIF